MVGISDSKTGNGVTSAGWSGDGKLRLWQCYIDGNDFILGLNPKLTAADVFLIAIDFQREILV